MTNRTRILWASLWAVLLSLALPALAEQSSHPISDSTAILFTNDIHCYYERDIGYDGLMLYRKELEQRYSHVILVDAGDAIQGAPIGAISGGFEPIRMMNAVGYDIATLGNHEFDFGFYVLDDLQSLLNCGYICANFCTADGESIYDPYRILRFDDTQIAFIGATTPYTFSKTPIHTMTDDTGAPLYDFKLDRSGESLVACLQACIDEVREKGADFVILIGHLGNTDDPLGSARLISRLKGLDAVIDGHSHEVYNIAVPDADGREIPLVQTGSYFDHVGVMILDADGSIHADLVSGIPAPEAWMEGIEAIEITRGNRSRWVDKAMHEFLEDITEAYAPMMNRRIGESPCELALTAADGAASSKSHENGMCELVADAYRAIAGTDISIINAGSVRNGLPAGEITFNTVLNVMPYSNDIWIARLSGQTILDALEFGCRDMPKACAGFPQVSGLEFTVDLRLDSSVQVDEKGDFTGVCGARRVRDVFVGAEPLNPEKMYTVAASSYLLEGGDNFKMLADHAEVIGTTLLADNLLLADYIENNLNGIIPTTYLRENRIHEILP